MPGVGGADINREVVHMLTAYQASTVAYMGDGYIIHDHHVAEQDPEARGLTPLSQYEASEDGRGLTCDECGEYIEEPSEDYCMTHDGWRAWSSEDGALDHCDEFETGLDECSFYGSEDPNPPAPRWVPCGSCGAGDGEPHRESCSTVQR